jgi:RNA polymerase sigma-70 factor, ECF subfamily
VNKPVIQRRPSPSLADASEAELVAAARARDEAAVRELIRRMNPRLFRVARGIVASDAEAEEVVQEAYLAAFTRLDTFRAEASFATWITRIALNAALMRSRRVRPHEEYDTVAEAPRDTVLPFPGSGTDQPDAALGQRQVRELLERAVAELPPDLRLVFILREAEGLSTLAIARDLSLNPVTVKTRLFRARLRLRRSIEQRLRGGFDAIFPFGGARCSAMADRVVAALRLGGSGPGDGAS